MPKLITASSFMLFWVFYFMSGGADFEPRDRIVLTQAPFAQPARTTVRHQTTNATPAVVNAGYTPVQTESLSPVAPQATVQSAAYEIAAVPATPTPEAAPTEALAITVPTLDLRSVAGNRVNMRTGPGTNHPVLETLPKGTMAEIISANDAGWAQIRLTETGQTGWMSVRLLSDS